MIISFVSINDSMIDCLFTQAAKWLNRMIEHLPLVLRSDTIQTGCEAKQEKVGALVFFYYPMELPLHLILRE